ncbi:MAG: serine hydrolase domain-containing protein, partial [Deltaproteobacteria bacterium]
MYTSKKRQHSFLLFTSMILILSTMVGCGPSTAELEAVDYTPLPGDDWKVSTPGEQGLDPKLVAELYHNAAGLETLYGLLVIKNGHLVAEGYFNGGPVEQKPFMASATKSITSALVGVALDQGCLASLDQNMIDFFPEFADQINDPRKEQITIRDLLKMRSGFVWEERTQYMESFFSSGGYWLPFLVDFPLTSDPGTEFGYSNLSSHILGVIVSRACETDLNSFAEEYLFSPINAEVGDWSQDADDNFYGAHAIQLSARDRAKFGLLYLNDGKYEGDQVISAEWISDSLQKYSDRINLS